MVVLLRGTRQASCFIFVLVISQATFNFSTFLKAQAPPLGYKVLEEMLKNSVSGNLQRFVGFGDVAVSKVKFISAAG